jgi:hypothetical protein
MHVERKDLEIWQHGDGLGRDRLDHIRERETAYTTYLLCRLDKIRERATA